MPKETTLYQLPYLEGGDGGRHIKEVSLKLAERLEAVLASTGQLPLDGDLRSLLTRLADIESGFPTVPWTVLQPGNGFTANPQFPPRYCVRAGALWLSGAVYRKDAPTTFTTVFTLPYAPFGQVREVGRHDLTQYVAITNSGQVQLTATKPATGGAGYTLDGVSFAL